MIDLLRDMLRTPEAQPSPYEWAAVLVAHAFIGVALTALVGCLIGAWRGAAVVAIGYLLLWEGTQIAVYGGGIADSLVDAAAVACGTVVAAGAWRNKGWAVGAALAALAAVGIGGTRKRR